ncbi:MAG: hypothetical protein PHP88_03295 [bacterium]|nr:hypothetical protein [bacterium]
MHSKRIVPFIGFLFFLSCAFSTAVASDDIDHLVAQTVKAYGGEKALRNASAVRHTGQVTAPMRGGGSGEIVREFERPDKLRVVIRYASDIEVRIYDGKTGWRQGGVVTGPPRDAMVLQAARMALPLILLDRKGDLVDRGRTVYEGKEVRTLELPLGSGLALTVDIDPALGRILRSTGRGGDRGSGVPLEFVTSYMDYRIVDGLLHSFREGNFANGFVTGETTLSRVEVLKSLPPETFRP